MHRYTFPHEPVANSDAIVGGGAAQYRFTVLADGLLRYEWAPDHQFEDRASVFAINRRLPVPKFRVKDTAHNLQIITSKFHLTYDKTDFSPSGLSVIVKGFFHEHGSVWRYGEKYADLGGTARTLDEANGRIPLESGIVAKCGFAVLDDSTSMLFDNEQWVATRRPGDRIDGYLFAYGHDYAEALKAFYALSGPQPLLPRWALGNWWSRYYAYTADEYLELVDRFRDRGIPLSVGVLDMDWHLVDDPRVAEAGVTGWTGYTWNEKLFPDPPAFLAELRKRGLKTSLNDHPADGVQRYEEPYQEMAQKLNHDTSMGDPIPFDITDRAFLDAYFDILHRRFEKQGVDLWWVDWQQGKHSHIAGIDPLWVLNHFHFLDSQDNGRRPLNFSRYAGPGSHRYPVGFSGDTFVTWESLHFQPEFTASASNIGFGWWSHDIGGHMHGIKDNELLVRWVQLGVFSPILRLHSSCNPWNIKEPWNLEPAYETVMTTFLQLRHQLLPYLYAMNVRAAVEGLPLVQPMYWSHTERKEAYETPNQFLFGSELLVVPITTPHDSKSRLSRVPAWLPPGRHIDITTGMVYDGDRLLWLNRRLAEYPVFAREGAIVPFDAAPAPLNDCSNPEAIDILVVVGADGSFELIEDDGTGQHVGDVQFHRTPIKFTQESGKLDIGSRIGGKDASETRSWQVSFMGYVPDGKIQLSLNGGPLDSLSTEISDHGITAKLGSHKAGDKLTVKVGENPQLHVANPTKRIMNILRDFHMELDLKEQIWAILDRDCPVTVKIGELHALELEIEILSPLLESLLADSRSVV
jgi:alpha-glucosidase (family GH31 glycosyl hydrolase)